MTKMSEIRVTLSPDLWNQFLQRAAETGVPLKWLVAGLVCDTLKNAGQDDRLQAAPARCERYDNPIDLGMSAIKSWSAESRPCRATSSSLTVGQ
jgi:hypothetical protein